MQPKTKTEEKYGDVEFLYRDAIPEEKADLGIRYDRLEDEVVIDDRTGEPASGGAETAAHPPDPGKEGLWPFPDAPAGSEQTGDLILLDVGPLSAADDAFLF